MTDRTTRVVEERCGSGPEGPWGEPVTLKVADAEEPLRDWDTPYRHPIYRHEWSQRRVVTYVPESELERGKVLLDRARPLLSLVEDKGLLPGVIGDRVRLWLRDADEEFLARKAT